MAKTKKIDDQGDLPPGLAQPAIRALHAAGITRLDQLSQMTESELMKLHGMGPNAMAKLRDALKAKGKTLAP